MAHFNDVNSDHSHSLAEAIGKLPGVDTLKFKPQVENEEVGEQIVKQFETMNLVPTLFFVDPWGYKGLSLRLVNSVLKDWGCDCIFFFNYNRISMGLNNPYVKQHMAALFGAERAEGLRVKVEGMKPHDRENAIVEELASALKQMGGRYVLPFRFRDSKGTRTSHHLIFVSKHVRGYEIMKGIMARESSSIAQGVGSFEYSPADAKYPLLFEMARPLDDLSGLLLAEFAGKQLTMRQIYEQHHVGRPFIDKNYKDALKILEQSNRIVTNPSAANRPRNTFADRVLVKFPVR
jgi:three-Cys-motif partner protein